MFMQNNQLTNLRIGFALNGYENDILSWLEIVIDVFDSFNYPLKSVSYDIDYNKFERKTLKTFRKNIIDNLQLPIDKLYSFTVFSAEKQNIPLTYHYGCFFDVPSKLLVLFFDSSYSETRVLMFYNKILQRLLNNKIVQSGYLFYQERHYDYPFGRSSLTQNFYNEDGNVWWMLMKPENRLSTFSKNNMYRHIYKQNILSKQHMEEHFDGLSLEKWIHLNNYGIVEKIGIENWLWIIPEDKLYEIQVAFYNKRLLLGVFYPK